MQRKASIKLLPHCSVKLFLLDDYASQHGKHHGDLIRIDRDHSFAHDEVSLWSPLTNKLTTDEIQNIQSLLAIQAG